MHPVYLVAGKRTPQAKAGGVLKDVEVPFLGVAVLKELLNCHGLGANDVDEVIVGNVGGPAKYANISRVIALESGLSKRTSAYSVHRNCASAMEAMAQGFLKIGTGRAQVVAAGGVESMSQMPLYYGPEMVDFFMGLMKAKTAGAKLGVLKKFRPRHLRPVIAIEQGLTDSVSGLNMGQTAEVLAREFSITREQQDEFANRSHQLAAAAVEERFDSEIVGLVTGKKLDQIVTRDQGPRQDSSLGRIGQDTSLF